MSYPLMLENAKKYGIPVVNSWEGTATSFEDFMKQARDVLGLEGYVLKFEDGRMIKVKTMWYYNLSRGLSVETNSNSEKFLWKTILENKYDDAKSFIAIDERPTLDKFAEELVNRLEDKSISMKKEVNVFKQNGSDKKTFTDWVKNKEHDGLYWQLFLEDSNPTEVTFKHIIKVLNAKKGFEKVKTLAGDLSFKSFLDENKMETSRTKFSDWH